VGTSPIMKGLFYALRLYPNFDLSTSKVLAGKITLNTPTETASISGFYVSFRGVGPLSMTGLEFF
jgi:hypothetical protein